MKDKHIYGLFFVLGISLLLSLCYIPTYDRIRDDREIFSYAGMAILKGAVPYRDFFDHKPPGIYFINAADQLFGGAWALWTLDALLALAVTALLYRRCRQYGLFFPWLLPLLFNLMIRDNLITNGIAMTREYSTFLFVLFFCVFIGRGRYREILLGVLTGLIFFIQQDQLLPLLPFLLYLILVERNSPGYWQLGRITIGFCIVLAPLIVYFAIHHSLGYFWEDAFRFNWSWYTTQPKSFGDHFRSIKQNLDTGNYELPFMVALVLGATSLFFGHKKRRLLVVALAALFLSLAPEFMGQRLGSDSQPISFLAYFLPLAGSVTILLFVTLAFAGDLIPGKGNARLPYALLLCCSLGYTAFQHATHLRRKDKEPVLHSPELGYLRQHPPGNYELYVFNNDYFIYAYNEFHILSPSRWIYMHMWNWYPQWDTDHVLLRTIAADLRDHRTKYIIFDPARLQQFASRANAAWWMEFMQTEYEPLAIAGSNTSNLWVKK